MFLLTWKGNKQLLNPEVLAVFSHLSTNLPKHCSLGEHCKDHAYQLVCCCEYRFVERLPLTSLLSEVGPEGSVMLNNAGRHHPDYSSEVPVASLRYPAGPFELA